MRLILRRKLSIFAAALLAAALALTGCGGGSGADSPDSLGSPSGSDELVAQGAVGVVITDAPSDEFDQILATITRIELLGNDESAIIFTGNEQIDLSQLANFSELFAIADADAGIYTKIRLILTDLELVKLNNDGTVAESIHPRLTGNGKIDLDPGREFLVTADNTLLLELDFDVEKSIKYNQSGNGEYHFRPVVFVRVLNGGAAGRLSRIFGRIGRVNYSQQRFELCQKELMSDLDDDDDFDREHCVEVVSSTDTGIFSPSGDPTDFGSIMTGEFATAVGFISSRVGKISMLLSMKSEDDSDSDSDGDSDDDNDSDSDDRNNSGSDDRNNSGSDDRNNSGSDDRNNSGSDDRNNSGSDDRNDSDSDDRNSGGHDDDDLGDIDIILDAAVIKLGKANTFAHLKGTAQSDVDAGREFDLLLAPGQGFVDAAMVTARLQDGSRIYSRNGVRLDDRAITRGVMGAFDGVLMLVNDEPDLLKMALAVLDINSGDEEVLRGEILTQGEDRRLMLATGIGDRCVDVPPETDIFLVKLMEGGLVSERGSYADLLPGLNIDIYGESDPGGCFIADAIIADQTDVTPPPGENRPPVANAGSDQTVETGTGVMLDGTGSSDPDGDPLSYSWTLDAPAGSTAILSAADTATPSFTTDVDGNYLVTLVVNDSALDSAPDVVTVTAAPPGINRPPVANAGGNQAVETGTGVSLDGSASSDPDGDSITYSWSLVVPGGSSANLGGANTASPTLTPDVDGDYVATLIVNDGNLDSNPDSVTVTASTTVVPDGFKLYADNCQMCHGPLGNSSIGNRTAAGIQSAINKNKGGMGSLSFLTPEEIQAISDALTSGP